MAKGVGHLIRRAAKGTSWSQFIDYASPALFEVMPMRPLLTQGKEFMSNGSDAERFGAVRQEVALLLAQRAIAVELDQPAQPGDIALGATLPEEVRRHAGQRILELYFAQLFGSERTILDLRTESFALREGDRLLWQPRAFYLDWQPEFLAGLRDLYAGFYLDDEARFAQALSDLGLQDSGDALREHLGSGDQRSVRFETSVFHSSFHNVFLTCRDRGVALHRNFLALGIYLVCLYDALEALDLEFDVRAAFERAVA